MVSWPVIDPSKPKVYVTLDVETLRDLIEESASQGRNTKLTYKSITDDMITELMKP